MSIFCDLSKAFDVISHTILIKKLEYYGIRGIVKNWLINYLSGRTQYVEIENNASSVSKIKCGVPQGSILGPLLYLIYVNDIGKCTKGNVLSFADDTSLVLSHQNPQTLYHNANLEINKLYNWFCANKLSLNAIKTKYIVIREPYDKSDITGLSLSINGVPLSQIGNAYGEKSTKFIGIYIDEFLTWNYHLTHINNRISRALFMIRQTKHFLPVASLRTLYFAMIHPHISYGILAWGKCNPNNT